MFNSYVKLPEVKHCVKMEVYLETEHIPLNPLITWAEQEIEIVDRESNQQKKTGNLTRF